MGLRGRNNLTNCTCFFITTTVFNFRKIFQDNYSCQLLIENIKHYQNKYNFSLHAYVIMPSHFHWIVKNNISYGTISDVMRDIKKYSAWDIMEYLSCKSKNNKELISEATRGYDPKQKNRFWMERFDDQVIRNDKMRLMLSGNGPRQPGAIYYLTEFHNDV